jgi:hypothetical protein
LSHYDGTIINLIKTNQLCQRFKKEEEEEESKCQILKQSNLNSNFEGAKL